MDKKINKIIKQQNYSFSPYFADKVINKVNELNNKKFVFNDLFISLPLLFKRIYLLGFATIIVLLFVYYFSQGDFLSSYFGLENVSTEKFNVDPILNPFSYWMKYNLKKWSTTIRWRDKNQQSVTNIILEIETRNYFL